MDNRYNVSDGDYECNHKNEDFGLRDSDPIKMYGEKKQKKLPKKNARNDVWKVRDERSVGTSSSSYREQLDAFRRQNGINVPTSSTNKNSYGNGAKIVRYYYKNLSCNIYFYSHINNFKSSLSVTNYKTKNALENDKSFLEHLLFYSAVYGNNAICLALLIAVVTSL